MHARIVMFKMGPGTKETADVLREKISQAMSMMDGLEKAYFMADFETGTYSSIALWKTKEAGDAAFKLLSPKLNASLNGLVEEKPLSHPFEVVQIVQPG